MFVFIVFVGEEIVEEVFAEDYDEPGKTETVSPSIAHEAPILAQPPEEDNTVREVVDRSHSLFICMYLIHIFVALGQDEFRWGLTWSVILHIYNSHSLE